MSKYVSSIISKYGDVDLVKRDAKTLRLILSRQGTKLLIDVIADHVGKTALKYKLTQDESKRLLNDLIDDLKESILERI